MEVSRAALLLWRAPRSIRCDCAFSTWATLLRAVRKPLRRSGVYEAARLPRAEWIGEGMRELTLTDQAGKPWRLSDALKTGAVVLVFYRGEW
jgi:hypothetical protein